MVKERTESSSITSAVNITLPWVLTLGAIVNAYAETSLIEALRSLTASFGEIADEQYTQALNDLAEHNRVDVVALAVAKLESQGIRYGEDYYLMPTVLTLDGRECEVWEVHYLGEIIRIVKTETGIYEKYELTSEGGYSVPHFSEARYGE